MIHPPIPNPPAHIPQQPRTLQHQRRHTRIKLQLRGFQPGQHPFRHDVLHAIGAIVQYRRDESHGVESQFGSAAEDETGHDGYEGECDGGGGSFLEDEAGEEDGEGGGGGFDGFDEGDRDVFEGDEAEDYGDSAEDADYGHVADEGIGEGLLLGLGLVVCLCVLLLGLWLWVLVWMFLTA
mmetsp:Transcript_10891/g.22778  ORF Transcript_10891/g.22778 Transcript_10891/m.22778 type:complete len:180 (-) Transcript_10891:274-813(-)